MMRHLLLVCNIAIATFAVADTAKLSVYVCDSATGKPLKDAKVTAWFDVNIGWRAWSEMTPIVTDVKVTDGKGVCHLSGKTNTGKASVEVREPPSGYYKANGGSVEFKSKSLFGTWRPDNVVVTVALDRVEKPVPLHVRNLSFPPGKLVEEMSDMEKGPVSYDFLQGDWLPPWGSGEFADVVFRRLPREDCGVGVNGRGQTNQSFRDVVSVDFPGDGNGMVETSVSATSELKIRLSSTMGFKSHYEQSCGRGKDLQAYRMRDKRKCFCFRIRTKYDEKGNVVEGYYGKIYGDVVMEWSYLGVSRVGFLYYLNPTPNDRNLEWDMKNNLCPNPGNLGNKLMP